MPGDEIKHRVTVDNAQAVEGLRQVVAEEVKMQTATKAAGQAAQEASRHVETRRQKLSELRERLVELHLQEQRLIASSQQAGQADERRRGQMERLSRVLATHSAAEREASASIDKHVGGLDKVAEGSGLAEKASQSLLGSLKNLAMGPVSWAAGFVSFASLIGIVTAAIAKMKKEADDAYEAMSKTGNKMAELAGSRGNVATQIHKDLMEAAIGSGVLGQEDLTEMENAAKTVSDLRPKAGRQEIVRIARRIGLLRSAGLNVSGGEGVRAIMGAEASLGLNEEASSNLVAALLGSGIGQDLLSPLINRAGRAGGVNFLSQIMAARSHGFDTEVMGRRLPGLLGRLTPTDEKGRVKPSFRKAGVAKGDDAGQVMSKLLAARKSGAMSETQFIEAVGGLDDLDIFNAIAASSPEEIDAARRGLTSPTAASDMAAMRMTDESSRFAMIKANQKLREQRLAEDPVMASRAAVSSEVELNQKELDRRRRDWLRAHPGFTMEKMPAELQSIGGMLESNKRAVSRVRGQISGQRQFQGVDVQPPAENWMQRIINQTININQQFNAATQPAHDVREPGE